MPCVSQLAKKNNDLLVLQPQISEQHQSPDHEYLHQDYHDPLVQLQELRDGDCRKRPPYKNTGPQDRIEFRKNTAPITKPTIPPIRASSAPVPTAPATVPGQ